MAHRSIIDTLLGIAGGPLVGLMVGGAVLLSLNGLYEAGLNRFFEDVGQQKSTGPMLAILQVVIGRLARFSTRFNSADAMARLKRRMIMAGMDMRDTILKRPEDFIGMQILAALGGALLVIYMWATVHMNLIWTPVAMLLIGFGVYARFLRVE